MTKFIHQRPNHGINPNPRAKMVLEDHLHSVTDFWNAQRECEGRDQARHVVIMLDLDDARAHDFATTNGGISKVDLLQRRNLYEQIGKLPVFICTTPLDGIVEYLRALEANRQADRLLQPIDGRGFRVLIFSSGSIAFTEIIEGNRLDN